MRTPRSRVVGGLVAIAAGALVLARGATADGPVQIGYGLFSGARHAQPATVLLMGGILVVAGLAAVAWGWWQAKGGA